jgi:hypothetical protein
MLFAKCNSNDQVMEDEMDRDSSTHGEKRNTYRSLVGRPGGKGELGIPRRRWEYNVKMDLRAVVLGDMDWTDLDRDRD